MKTTAPGSKELKSKPRRLVKYDRGLGTAYERWAIYSKLEQICGELKIKRAMEGPVDGMAGIPGVHLLTLAHKGVDVLAVHETEEGANQIQEIYAAHELEYRASYEASPLPPVDCNVDLAVSFNALPLVEDWRVYIDALFATGARYVVLVVTNPTSYGVYLRKTLRLLEKSPPTTELFEHETTSRSVIKEALLNHGQILRHEFLDCPWWPDLFVPTGESLWSGTLKRFGRTGNSTDDLASASFTYGTSDFPYRDAHGPQELIRAMKKHPRFENAPRSLAQLFGHHQLYLVERNS